jgi:ABC-type oligopeptide transport system substrate-binding subunit
LQETVALAPLFNDVDYRVASAQVRGLKLRSFSPTVNYAELGKAETAAPSVAPAEDVRGTLQIPMSSRVGNFDSALVKALEENEVLPNVFETLTRGVGDARIGPWLAEHFVAEDGGTKYRFRLRSGVRFHDGRRLTVRDVRYSFERLLQSEESHPRWMYSPIRGAKEMLEGRASALSGFHIHSAREFTIELEKPISFFPALIAYTAASIVPEGTERFGSSWREGSVGTGPFRIVRFEPNRTLELERNPSYWREGYPRCQGVVFHFGVPSNEILSGFRSGRFSVAADLFPSDLETLRRDADLASGYREKPRLTTFFLGFNVNRGPLKDKALRERLSVAFDAPTLVQQTLGSLAIPAHGLIPPGLLGHESGASGSVPSTTQQVPDDKTNAIELSAAIHPILEGEFSALKDGIVTAFRNTGFELRSAAKTVDEYANVVRSGAVDLFIGRWNADYLDADSFVNILHTKEGWLGPLLGSPEMDELIERGRVETDPATRHAIYRQIESTLRRDIRLLPLFHEQTYRFARPEVEGLSVSYWVPIVAYEELRLE